jgi:hypothetical protein
MVLSINKYYAQLENNKSLYLYVSESNLIIGDTLNDGMKICIDKNFNLISIETYKNGIGLNSGYYFTKRKLSSIFSKNDSLTLTQEIPLSFSFSSMENSVLKWGVQITFRSNDLYLLYSEPENNNSFTFFFEGYRLKMIEEKKGLYSTSYTWLKAKRFDRHVL